jgi:hypothetical protein
MNKKTWIAVGAIAAIGFCGYILFAEQHEFFPRAKAPMVAAFDPLNATYVIEGQSVALINGKASSPAAPGSATQVTTMIFGEPTIGDLNGDGVADAALMLVQDPGGSGTFYYVAAAIRTATGTQGTNAVLLGDRIAPQNVEIKNGTVIANYADRKAGEPMSTSPSVGVSKYLIYNGSAFEEVQR